MDWERLCEGREVSQRRRSCLAKNMCVNILIQLQEARDIGKRTGLGPDQSCLTLQGLNSEMLQRKMLPIGRTRLRLYLIGCM